MRKGVLIKTTGEMEWKFPKDGKHFTLEELQAFVGGYIELVRLQGEIDLFCNEDGIRLQLPFNFVASALVSDDKGYKTGILEDVIMGPYEPEPEEEEEKAEGAKA